MIVNCYFGLSLLGGVLSYSEKNESSANSESVIKVSVTVESLLLAWRSCKGALLGKGFFSSFIVRDPCKSVSFFLNAAAFELILTFNL